MKAECIYSIILSLTIASNRESSSVTGVLSLLSLLLVLFATPAIITLGWLSHSNLTYVFNAWMLVAVLTLILLAILCMHAMLTEEARKSRENNLSEIRRDLLSLLKYRHILIPMLILSILGGVGYFLRLFSAYFSLQLVYAAVIILALETVFHSLYRYWPVMLKGSTRYQNLLTTVIIIIGLLLSLLVIGTAGAVLISIVFAGFILVGGIGLAFVVDTTASSLSHLPFATKRSGVSAVLIAFILLAVWLWFTGDIVGYISGIGVGVSGSHVISGLKSEYQALLSGTNISFLGVVSALIAAAVYLVSLKLRKSQVTGASNAMFILTSIPMAGFVLMYLAILTDGDWIASVGHIGSVYSDSIQLIPSITLFIVGYSQILVEIPRKTSRLLMQEENKFIVSLTWLILFSALAEFLSWLVYGQPGEFIFEADLIQWFGIPIGIALLSAKYVKIRRKSNFATN